MMVRFCWRVTFGGFQMLSSLHSHVKKRKGERDEDKRSSHVGFSLSASFLISAKKTARECYHFSGCQEQSLCTVWGLYDCFAVYIVLSEKLQVRTILNARFQRLVTFQSTTYNSKHSKKQSAEFGCMSEAHPTPTPHANWKKTGTSRP